MTPSERVYYDVGLSFGVGQAAAELAMDHLRGQLDREPKPHELDALTEGFLIGVRADLPPERRIIH